MRRDAIGLFWEDLPKEVVKRVPPSPVWLNPDYLPGLEEALEAPGLEIMTDTDLAQAAQNKDAMLFDIECYENYFLASFRSYQTGKAIYFERYEGHPLNPDKLQWILDNCLTVGFNSLGYDIPITTLALNGWQPDQLKEASGKIINDGWRPSDVLKQARIKRLFINHIDLIEVAPLRANLKIYGGRLHTPRMQDLPFHPNAMLSPQQRAIVRWYNLKSDLTATAYLYHCLQAQLALRAAMSNEIGIDMRSKSDAQIAETVIGEEYFRRTGGRPKAPVISEGTAYRYDAPAFLKFTTRQFSDAFQTVQDARFIVDAYGACAMPDTIKDLKLSVNNTTYRMGIGGLHSTEKCTANVADADYVIVDKDVTSYYPFIILNLGLFPQHLGRTFLQIYRSIVDRRLEAKRSGNKNVSESLKITINGTFGKLGNMYSILYSPDLLIQVTLTGQLALLMLIERLESAGIHVISANTDGVTSKCPLGSRALLDSIVHQWEKDTGFTTEETRYAGLYSRDVNNYIAVKEGGGTKRKGAYANPWSSATFGQECLHKNPVNTICIEAVEKYLTEQLPVTQTINACRDIRKFVTVRTVKGGAAKVWQTLKEGQEQGRVDYLGKSLRWYYATGITGEIVAVDSGNKVPRSDGAKPLLDLPDSFPIDIDYQWYIAESEKILTEIGVNHE